MKFLKKIKIIFLLLSITLFWGCSNDKLSREKASKLIQEKVKFPYDEIMKFHTYTKYESPVFKNLQNEGLLTYTERKEEWVIEGTGYWASGTLTEKGKQYTVSESPATGEVTVKTSKLEFGEITGIVETKETNTAIVNYTLYRKDVTPFGSIVFKLKEGPIDTNITFKKFDDGWRVNH